MFFLKVHIFQCQWQMKVKDFIKYLKILKFPNYERYHVLGFLGVMEFDEIVISMIKGHLLAQGLQKVNLGNLRQNCSHNFQIMNDTMF